MLVFFVQLDNKFLMGSSSSDNNEVVFIGLTFPQITIANYEQIFKIHCLKALVSDQIGQKTERNITLGEMHIYTYFCLKACCSLAMLLD